MDISSRSAVSLNGIDAKLVLCPEFFEYFFGGRGHSILNFSCYNLNLYTYHFKID